jgi:hypothetical protein
MTEIGQAHDRFVKAAIVLASYANTQAEMQSADWIGDRSPRARTLRAKRYAEALEEYQQARAALDKAAT